ncbi:hypothetical protein MBANPS3_003154 [Mucor bainieri]
MAAINAVVAYGQCDILANQPFMKLKLSKSLTLSSSEQEHHDTIIQSLNIATKIEIFKSTCNISNALISKIIKALRSKDKEAIHIAKENDTNWKKQLEKDEYVPATATTLSHISKHFVQQQIVHQNNYNKPTHSLTIDEQALQESTDIVVKQYATRFLGCIIEFPVCTIYITSLDAFVHLGKDKDDCANRLVKFEKHAYAKIREKANFGISSYEVSIFIGSLELLAVGGIVVTKEEDAQCFLGSSVKPLIPIMTHGTETISQQVRTTIQPSKSIYYTPISLQFY